MSSPSPLPEPVSAPGGISAGPGVPPSPPVPVPGITAATRPVITYLLVGIPVGLFCLHISPVEMGGMLEAVQARMETDFTLGEVWRMLVPLVGSQELLPLIVSMYTLIIIGPGLEKRYGGWRFLALYLVSGYTGNVLAASAWLQAPHIPQGAVPAVAGLIGAQTVFALHHIPLFGARATAVVHSSIRLFLLNLAVVMLPIGVPVGDGMAMGRVWSILGGTVAGLSFARFGGPTWEVVDTLPHLRIVDNRPRLHSLFIALILAGLAFLFAQMTLMSR